MNSTVAAPRFEVPDSPAVSSPDHQLPTAAPRGKPVYAKGCPLPIYRTRWTSKVTRRTYSAWVIIWRDAGSRRREKHSDLAKAKTRAPEIWTNICNGQTLQNQFTEADRASFRRSRELIYPTGKSLETVAAEYAEASAIWRSALGDVPPAFIATAIQFYVEHQPKGVVPKNIPALVEDLLTEKRRLGAGDKWLNTLSQQLKRFSGKFDCPLHALSAHEITTWLDTIKGGLRTRKNYRDSVRELVRYAQAKGQLSRTWDEMAHVEDAAVPPVEVEIYTADQIQRFLAARQRIEDRGRTNGSLIPFMSLAAFAGIRHEEMNQRGDTKPVLDWSCIDLDAGFIRIRALVGKTKRLRIIHMHPNLIEWLRPYAKPSGPICELSQTAGALDRAKKLAGLPSKRGELTNSLRSTFISCRLAETNDIGLVAREAGNSPQVIQRNDLELATPRQAAAHFAITPCKADILPLFAWANTRQ
ncbi:MAG: hypothetical protein NT154_06710 [Verrucomicrobia bacterium]|nr:hypothetical protein [Verrucomicrobiota bacterium]